MKIDAAVAVTYNPEIEKLLVLKRDSGREEFPGKWEFPAGRVEGAESYKDAALRELKEETGLVGELVKSGSSFSFEQDDTYFHISPFLVIVENDDVELSKEHTDYKWLELEEILDLDTVPRIKTDLKTLDLWDKNNNSDK